MLERLVLKNFQGHENLDIELDPAVTSITGANDSGKSSALRGLQWILTNQSFKKAVRIGATFAHGELHMDGHVLTREQGKGINTYQIDEQEPHRAFGQGVPADVAALANVCDANVANQHDNLFWFSDTAGQVSRELNAIINLEVIDATLANVAAEVRDARAGVADAEKALSAARERKEALAWVAEIDAALTVLEAKGEELAEARWAHEGLEELVNTAVEWGKKAEVASKAALDSAKVAAAGKRVVDATAEVADLKNLLDQLEEWARVASLPVPDIGSLQAAWTEWKQEKERWRELNAAVFALEQAELQAKNLQAQAKKARQELDAATEGRCPVCKQEMPMSLPSV